VHDVQVPKWVQKRKQVHPDEGTGTVDYEQPRRAAKVVVNMKFSLIAVGTQWYVNFFLLRSTLRML
jgi:RAB6A-GEF complex partner protein 1